ncbi:hypothetical protein [Streptomyces sp. NPDC093089]|uniref:hypothetical protein n=1 Tax=Streptomyces sp. NPDC093089 TaxID=3366024 RepID=UPI0037FF0153
MYETEDPLADLTAPCLRRIARHQARPAPASMDSMEAAGRPGIELLRALITARLGDRHSASEPCTTPGTCAFRTTSAPTLR